MYCGKCGAQIADGAENCPNCGEPTAPANTVSGFVVKPRPAVKFAGFWLRAVAFVIDFFIITVIAAPAFYRPLTNNVGSDATPEQILAFYRSGTPQVFALFLLFQLIYALYHAAFEGSRWQATPGKRLLGLFVTDLNGKRPSFPRASARAFAKIISQFFLCAGYIAAAFTARKQALHDIIAGCLVLKKL